MTANTMQRGKLYTITYKPRYHWYNPKGLPTPQWQCGRQITNIPEGTIVMYTETSQTIYGGIKQIHVIYQDAVWKFTESVENDWTLVLAEATNAVADRYTK